MPSGWEFALLFFVALVLMGLLSWWQNTSYQREVNRLARAFAGPNRHLVTGRGKSGVRGAIVVLVVDVAAGTVLEAEAMTGASVFARLRPRPQLVGPLATVAERAGSGALRRGVESALERLPAAAGRKLPKTPSGPTQAGPALRSVNQKRK